MRWIYIEVQCLGQVGVARVVPHALEVLDFLIGGFGICASFTIGDIILANKVALLKVAFEHNAKRKEETMDRNFKTLGQLVLC